MPKMRSWADKKHKQRSSDSFAIESLDASRPMNGFLEVFYLDRHIIKYRDVQ